MNRRTFLSTTSVAGLSSLVGCNSGWSNPPDQGDPVDTESTTEPTPTDTDEQGEILAEFSGRKSTVTDSFATTYAQLRFDIDFSVPSGFTAHLTGPTDEQDDRLLLDVPHTAFHGTVIVYGQSDLGERALRIETDDMEGSEIDHHGWEITVWTPELILVDGD